MLAALYARRLALWVRVGGPRMVRKVNRLIAILASLAIGALLAGCGGGSESADTSAGAEHSPAEGFSQGKKGAKASEGNYDYVHAHLEVGSGDIVCKDRASGNV